MREPRTRRLPTLIPAALLLYLLLRPVSNNQILIPVLAGLALCAIAAIATRGGHLTAPAMAILFVQLIHGLIALLVGSLNTTPGLASQAPVLIAAPALFWLCSAAIRTDHIRLILTTVAVGTIIVSVGILLYVLGAQGILPPVLPESLLAATGAGVNLDGPSVAIRFYGLSTLVAAGPMLAVSTVLPNNPHLPGLKLRVTAATVAALAAMLTGRRALVLVLILAPATLWVIRRILDTRRAAEPSVGRRTSIVAVPATLGLAFVLTAATTMFPRTFNLHLAHDAVHAVNDNVFGGQGSSASPILADQSAKLFAAWSTHPLFGLGAGATIPGYWRDPARPWNFELQYHRLLMYGGLVGVVLFAVVLVLAVVLIRRAATAAPDATPALLVATVGAASILLANAYDPYLQAPGHMWAIYLPLAIANAVLVNRRPEPVAEATESAPVSASSVFVATIALPGPRTEAPCQPRLAPLSAAPTGPPTSQRSRSTSPSAPSSVP